MFLGRQRGADPERALHHQAIGRAAELEADLAQHADMAEPEALVQLDRRRVGGVNIGDHLAITGRRAAVDQRRNATVSLLPQN